MLKTSKILIAIFAVALSMANLVSCGGKAEKATQAAADSAEVQGTSAPAKAKAEAPVEGLPTVIDFYATWCGPCKNIAPLFEMLKGEYAGKVNFVSVDVDADIEMASRYHIDAMPTFVFLDAEGNEVNRIVGADSAALSEAVDKLASQAKD